MTKLFIASVLILASFTLSAAQRPLVASKTGNLQDNLENLKNLENFKNLNDQQYRWLYEELIPQKDRQELPNESFKSFRVHLQDSYSKFPQPSQIELKNLKLVNKIEGSILYAGLLRKKYKYDVLINNEELVLNVRIHLQNATHEDLKNFLPKLKQAESLWNDSRVKTDFKYVFKFEFVTKQAGSHFSVRILDTTRGPYDTFWGRHWTGNVMAHEVGHMLGLGDEYQTISGNMDCLTSSLMCTAWKGSLMRHHYYFILRRLVH